MASVRKEASSTSHSATISRLQAAQIDGRADNIRYRQGQLHYLHEALRTEANKICNAIVQDTGCKLPEAQLEYASAMRVLRDVYNALNFDQSIMDEYRVTKGSNYPNRTVGVGTVYIAATSRASPFFSLLSPLATAIAAGNCVMLEVSNTLRALPALLQKVLSQSLDTDTFAIVDSDCMKAANSNSISMVVLQDWERDIMHFDTPLLQSTSSASVVAVVDRTADIQSAAQYLLMARFSFAGKAAYAPDLVLVNEFVKKPLLQALAQRAITYLDSGTQKARGNTLHRDKPGTYDRSVLAEMATKGSADIVSLGPNGCIVDVMSRESPLLSSKVNVPLLAVHAFSSLDDAIDLLNSNPAHHTVTGKPYLAAYVFGNPGSCKYLGQFINAQASFHNHIPANLLLGPAAPCIYPQNTSHGLDINARYTKAMFEVFRPQYACSQNSHGVSKSAEQSSVDIATLLDPATVPNTTGLIEAAVKPLKPTGQKLQARQVGFFEQGLITGGIIFVAPVLLSMGALVLGSAFYGGRLVYTVLLR